MRSVAAAVEVDHASAYLKGTGAAGSHRVQVMGAEPEIQGSARSHGKTAAVGAISF